MDEKQLLKKREELIEQLQGIGLFRRGSVNEVYRKCGKPNCRCAAPEHPGHGPQHTLTYKNNGKSEIKTLPTLKVRRRAEEQTRNHDGFIEWSREFLAVNERLCDLELEAAREESPEGESSREKKLRKQSVKRRPPKSSD